MIIVTGIEATARSTSQISQLNQLSQTRHPPIGYLGDAAVGYIVLEAEGDEFIGTGECEADHEGQAGAASVGVLVTLHIEGPARRIAGQQAGSL